MALIHEELSRQFHDWERRGRGWMLHPKPVRPEPPFRPFEGHYLNQTDIPDDGRKATFLGSLVRRIANFIAEKSPPLAEAIEKDEPEPELEQFEQDGIVEF